MAKMIIIDGNSLLFRAYYATSYGAIMRTKEGVPTNAVFAFANMINRILHDFRGDEHIIVAFDTGKKTFRHEELESYKANRKPCPEELLTQMPIARELLHSLAIFTYEQDGVEGDDIAGTVAKQAASQGYEVAIFTSDKDFLQLIDPRIEVHLLKKGLSEVLVVNHENMGELYGFEPMQILDYKGLCGDASDNLPGIPGVGDKTAIKLIQTYGSLESIIEHAPSMKEKLGQKILEYQNLGMQCKHLAAIRCDVTLPFTLEDTKYHGYDYATISEFCLRYELKQLLMRLENRQKKDASAPKAITYEVLHQWPEDQRPTAISIALDCEKGNYHRAELFGLSIRFEDKIYYFSRTDLLKDQCLQDILKDASIAKYAYDYKAIKVLLAREGLSIQGLRFDLLLAAYLLDSSLSNEPEAIFSFFGISLDDKSDISLFSLSNQQRSAEIAYYVMDLEARVLHDLENVESLSLYRDIELPLADVLADMEIEGFPVDIPTLQKIGVEYRQILDHLTQQIYDLAGEEFNISSPKQVAAILFEKLGLPGNRKGSTSIDILKALANRHPIVPLILEHRKYAKLLNTYIDGLESYVFPDGKLHAIFNQALTTTGRLSSSEPNLQNISVRDEVGKRIRQAFFYPDPNLYLLSLDYAQIELRILASLANCQKLIDAFNSGEDIHALTARHVFHLEGEVPAILRRKAKAVNFGIVYGISDWGLSEQIGVSPREAKEIIDRFYAAYPEIAAYLHQTVTFAESHGYVMTALGRRRYLREIHDSSYTVREFAKRAAMNAPIQGTSADLIKIAMIKIAQALKQEKLQAKMVLQIHDELLFCVSKEELPRLRLLATEAMENALHFKVRLEVDGQASRTWYDAK